MAFSQEVLTAEDLSQVGLDILKDKVEGVELAQAVNDNDVIDLHQVTVISHHSLEEDLSSQPLGVLSMHKDI